MTADLEDDIRTALHDRVAHVTADRLRSADMPASATRRTRRSIWTIAAPIAAPIAAAACVGLVALVLMLLPGHGDQKGSAGDGSGGAGLNSLIGTSWSLISVTEQGHAAVLIPARLSASITFERGAVLTAQDGVNFYRATYHVTGDGVVIGGAAGTLAGYAGDDPGTLAAINGIRAMLDTSGGRAAAHPVAAELSANQLRLTARGYTLVLGDEVPVATSAPPPSSTGTP